MDFSLTTQNKFWTFSNLEKVHLLKKNANTLAVKRIQETLGTKNPFLTLEEEKVYYEYHEHKLKEISQLYKKKDKEEPPLKVIATAITFFKRFYLQNSCMDYPLQEIMYTCLFLGFKNEERTKSIEDFLSISHFKAKKEKFFQVINDYELIIIEQLSFHLHVVHPMRSIDGFTIDLLRKKYISDEQQLDLYQSSINYCEQSFNTELMFVMSPNRIAIDCLVLSSIKLNIQTLIVGYFEDILQENEEKLINDANYFLKEIKKKEINENLKEKAKLINTKMKMIGHCFIEPLSEEFGLTESLF